MMLTFVLIIIIVAISLNYFNQNVLESARPLLSHTFASPSSSSLSAQASNTSSIDLAIQNPNNLSLSIDIYWKRISIILLICTLPLLWEGRAYEDLYLFNGLLLINSKLNLVVWLLVIIGSILITTLVQNNITQEVSRERIVFTLCAILGGIILNSATDFLTILLGLELQSYSVYILAASYRNYEPSEAAGLKYFLLGALSSALVFMGLAILYAYSGSTNLDHAFLMISLNQNDIILPYAGTILILAGISWKVAAAPLQAWSIDVYDAVPTRTTAVLSLLPKIALFSLLIRLISLITTNNLDFVNNSLSNYINLYVEVSVQIIIVIIALSLIIGSVAGLFQPRIKRLLAYSSVLNVGFILMGALLTNSTLDYYNPTLYIIQYIITTAAIWLCLINLSNKNNLSDITLISQLQGIHSDPSTSRTLNVKDKSAQLYYTFIAICLTALVLSTAGIPPMVGFYAKYSVIILALQSGYTTLALIAVLASIISTVYYLGVIKAIWSKSSKDKYNKDLYISAMNNVKPSNRYESTLIISFLTLIVVLYLLQYSVIYVILSL